MVFEIWSSHNECMAVNVAARPCIPKQAPEAASRSGPTLRPNLPPRRGGTPARPSADPERACAERAGSRPDLRRPNLRRPNLRKTLAVVSHLILCRAPESSVCELPMFLQSFWKLVGLLLLVVILEVVLLLVRLVFALCRPPLLRLGMRSCSVHMCRSSPSVALAGALPIAL